MILKRYGILLEKPNVSFSKLTAMIKTIMNNNLIPIIILQDGYENNTYLNPYNKIEIFRNKFPQLREDNFIVMDKDVNINNNRYVWKHKLKEIIGNINYYAFGTNDSSISDKCFVVNINRFALVKNNLLLISDQIDSLITDLFNIADVYNLKSINENEFDPYITRLFKDRNFDVIEYDTSFGNTFYNKVSLVSSNKAWIKLADPKYIDVINKYNLGSLLFGEDRKVIEVNDKEISHVLEFISNHKLVYEMSNVSENLDNKTIIIGNV